MIHVIVNKKRIQIFEFSSERDVINKYVELLEIDENLPILPRYLVFKKGVPKFIEGKEYKLSSILDDIAELDLNDLVSRENVSLLLTKYTLSSVKEIIILWIIIKGYNKLSQTNFIKKFNEDRLGIKFRELRIILRARELYDDIQKYIKNSKIDLKTLRTNIVEEEKLYKKLSKVKSPELSDFVLQESYDEIILSVNDDLTLYDIFDSMSLSSEIPYVTLVNGSTKITKIFNGIIPEEEWINKEYSSNYAIYIYLLTNIDGKDVYTNSVWFEDNVIRQVFNTGSRDTPDELTNKIIRSIDGIDINIEKRRELKSSGRFKVINEVYNQAVLLDMITNNDIFSNFLYLNEVDKTVSQKKRFTCYYIPDRNLFPSFENTLTITLSSQCDKNAKFSEVRISRATSISQINNFMQIFAKLFGLYMEQKQTIIREYKKIYPKIKIGDYEKTIVENKKDDKKTGKRLLNLKKFDANAFGNDYSKKCQPKYKQPYIVDPLAIDEVKSKLEERGGEKLREHGIIEWPKNSGKIFACYPREEGEQEDYIWPGLRVQTEKDVNYDDYKFLPCCYKVDQYTKQSKKSKSGLLKYLQENETGDEEKDTTVSEIINFERPLSSSKLAKKNRIAEIPYLIKVIGYSAGYQDIREGTKKFLSLVRLGVHLGPRSFVDCIQTSLFEDYRNSSDKESIVKNVLRKIAKSDNFSIGKQELYQYSDESIRKHLLSENSYIDPNLYISIFELHYGCNIFLFEMNQDNMEGEIVIPEHSRVYLRRNFDKEKPTVIIIKHEVKREWKYQCELVINYKGDNQADFLFEYSEHEKFIEDILSITEEINTVYITSLRGYEKYRPIR